MLYDSALPGLLEHEKEAHLLLTKMNDDICMGAERSAGTPIKELYVAVY